MSKWPRLYGRRRTVEDPKQFRLGRLPDGRWITEIHYREKWVSWCTDVDVHPDNPRPYPDGHTPVGF